MIRRTLGMISGLAGIVALIVSVPMTAAGREPFVSWYYAIAWFGLILFLDGIRATCGKLSLIFDRPLRFGALVFWSAFIWFIFEALNFRLANWYYIFVPDSPTERLISSWLSFGTVLPALFLIEQFLGDLGVFRTWPSFRIRFDKKTLRVLAALGVACLVLPMILPRYAFPLVWAFGFLLPLPLVIHRLDLTLVKDLQEGRGGRLMRILLAGMACGITWEFLNAFARTRWIYTVPFLEDLKLFEMPPLGFLGFPPFALECVVMYGMLVAFGLAPAVEGMERRKGTRKPRPYVAVFAGGLALAAGCLVLEGMDRYNIDSYTPRPDRLALPAAVRTLAGNSGIDDCFRLRAFLDNPVIRRTLHDDGVDVDRVKDLLDLALLRGIGVRHANRLAEIGVDSIADLAEQEAADLAGALSKNGSERDDRVLRARAKVWIKAAGEWKP